MNYALVAALFFLGIAGADEPETVPSYAVNQFVEISSRSKSIELVEIYPTKLSLLEFTEHPDAKKFKGADLFDGCPILSKQPIKRDMWMDLLKKQLLEKAPPRELGLNFQPTLVAAVEGEDGKVGFLKVDLELKIGRVEIGDMKRIIDLTPGFVAALRHQISKKGQ